MSRDERERKADEDTSSGATPGVNGGRSPLHGSQSAPDPPPQKPDGPSPDDRDGTRWEVWYQELKPLAGYLPMGKYEEDTERDGFMSYSVEVHAAIIGVSVGLAAALGGNVELLMMLVGAALGVGRIQQQFSETVTEHLIREPWYALGGAAVVWLGYALITGDYSSIEQVSELLSVREMLT